MSQAHNWGGFQSCVTEFIFIDYVLNGSIAKRAAFLTVFVAIKDTPKVGVIVVTLVGIAGHAKCLEIAKLVWTTFAARYDVIDMKCNLIFMRPAKLATIFCPLQNLVANRSTQTKCFWHTFNAAHQSCTKLQED